MANATPGPWRADVRDRHSTATITWPETARRSYQFGGFTIYGRVAESVASGTHTDEPTNHGEANAALIVAAVNDYARHLDMEDRVAALETALVEAAIPLEALFLVGNTGNHLSPEMWDGIQRAIAHVRRALFTGDNHAQ